MQIENKWLYDGTCTLFTKKKIVLLDLDENALKSVLYLIDGIRIGIEYQIFVFSRYFNHLLRGL